MGRCCSKTKVEDEEDVIIEKYRIHKVEELSNTFLKYDGERYSQKWYTSSIYSGIKDDKQEDYTVTFCKREISFLAKLSHTNIVKFKGVYYKPNNPQPILVMEEVTSNLMYHLDKVETLEESEKFKFSCGVSEGLAYLHSQRIAHLNLSTKSIFLTDTFVVKLANFEYAMNFLDDNTVRSSISSSAPPGGKSYDPWKFRDDKSVFNFLPINYFKRRAYDSLDIYSFGCVVFNIFTLKQPTQEIASEVSEISISGVQSLVSDCVCGQLDSMQEVNEKLTNVCLKEGSNSLKETAEQNICEVEMHHGSNLGESDQEPGRISNASKADESNQSDLTHTELEQKFKEISDINDKQKEELREAHEKVEELKKCLVEKNEGIETHNRSLTEKTDELKKCKEEFESKQTELKSEVEKLKYDNERLTEKTDELKKSKEELESIQEGLKSQIEKLKNDNERASEVSKVELAEKQQNDSSECKDVAVIPQQSLQKQVDELQKEKSTLISKLTKLEERSFAFTNAFTTADEGSVIKLRDTYRNLQANARPAANRAHKKVYKGIDLPIAEHTMIAYETAKRMALQEFNIVSEQLQSLFKLKATEKDASEEQHPKAMMQSQQLLDSFHTKPLYEEIYQILINQYNVLTSQAPDGIPQPVEDYYSAIAKFAWDCVARTIPMILSTDVTVFDGEMHETGDGDTEDDNEIYKGKDVTYVYPVLLTSNSWPREIALRGKVKVSRDSTITSKDITSEGKIKPLPQEPDVI